MISAGICNQKAIEKIFDIRLCFDYDTKPTWTSQWNNTDGREDQLINKAWANNTRGMIRAYVEGKHVITKEIHRLIEVTKDNFCNFEWVALGLIPWAGSVKVTGQSVGATIVTPKHRVTVFCNGHVQVIDRNDLDFNFATYGK